MVQTAAGSPVARLITAAAVRHDYPLVNLVGSESGAAVLRTRFPSVPVVTTSDPDWAGRPGKAGTVLLTSPAATAKGGV